jgi:hypothetical protein
MLEKSFQSGEANQDAPGGQGEQDRKQPYRADRCEGA